MKREDVLAVVKVHQRELQQLDVIAIDLFGAVARNESRTDGDVSIKGVRAWWGE